MYNKAFIIKQIPKFPKTSKKKKSFSKRVVRKKTIIATPSVTCKVYDDVSSSFSSIKLSKKQRMKDLIVVKAKID